jgi:hypothetical protein
LLLPKVRRSRSFSGNLQARRWSSISLKSRGPKSCWQTKMETVLLPLAKTTLEKPH